MPRTMTRGQRTLSYADGTYTVTVAGIVAGSSCGPREAVTYWRDSERPYDEAVADVLTLGGLTLADYWS